MCMACKSVPAVASSALTIVPDDADPPKGDLRGCKKVRALAKHNVQAVLDLCTCSAQQADEMDVQSVLSHHAIPAGSRGSYACAHLAATLRCRMTANQRCTRRFAA